MVVIADGKLGSWTLHGNPSESLEIIDYSEDVPGMHGAWDYGDEYGVRKMTLRLVSDYLTSDQKVAEMHVLNAMFATEQELSYEGLTYRVILEGQIEYTNHAHQLEASVPLLLTDPFGYSGEYETTTQIVNDGTAETHPIIEIYGSTTNPSVAIGSETLSWNGNVLLGETLVIDCFNKTVKKGSQNCLKDYNGVFPSIPAGQTVTVSSSSSFKAKWRNRYL